jgi:hypothetical protein
LLPPHENETKKDCLSKPYEHIAWTFIAARHTYIYGLLDTAAPTMQYLMRIIITILIITVLPLLGKGQTEGTLASVCKPVSAQWKSDSNSCKGYRLKLAHLFSCPHRIRSIKHSCFQHSAGRTSYRSIISIIPIERTTWNISITYINV